LRLHEYSNLNIFETSLMIKAFSIRYSISKSAQKDLLKLIHILLPVNNKLPRTIKKINEYANLSTDEIKTFI